MTLDSMNGAKFKIIINSVISSEDLKKCILVYTFLLVDLLLMVWPFLLCHFICLCDRFGHLACFTSDVEVFVQVLSSDRKMELFKKLIESSSTISQVPAKALGLSITVFKFQQLVGNIYGLTVGGASSIVLFYMFVISHVTFFPSIPFVWSIWQMLLKFCTVIHGAYSFVCLGMGIKFELPKCHRAYY